jgi:hypothetical protein
VLGGGLETDADARVIWLPSQSGHLELRSIPLQILPAGALGSATWFLHFRQSPPLADHNDDRVSFFTAASRNALSAIQEICPYGSG